MCLSEATIRQMVGADPYFGSTGAMECHENAQLELHGNAIDPSSSVQIQQLADNGGDKRVVARPPARSAPQPLVPHSYMLVNTPPGPAYTVPHAPEHAIQLLEENPLTLGQMAREKRMKSGGAQRRQGSVSQGASQNTNDSKLISVENGYRLSEEVMAERFAALATQGRSSAQDAIICDYIHDSDMMLIVGSRGQFVVHLPLPKDKSILLIGRISNSISA
ncbi:hypothetical protein CYMTET_30366 [Cymbomonas tetramitiformis]|uniref:Uncharacterized protein n=1 Tax=Cymbomonas tetramitiformis TaxID=36881 RepID=A0AAE0FKK3_9CHLO|nr:hypothetical protein CYMTET_30366 [Cymbomonas tetramitiformis]